MPDSEGVEHGGEWGFGGIGGAGKAPDGTSAGSWPPPESPPPAGWPPGATRWDARPPAQSPAARGAIGVLAVIGGIVVAVIGLIAVVALVEAASRSSPSGSSSGPGGGFPPPAATPYAEPSVGGMEIVMSPDGAEAYVTMPSRGSVYIVSLASGSVVGAIPVGPDPTGIALSPDGRTAYVANTNVNGGGPGYPGAGTVSVIDTASDRVVDTVDVGQDPLGVAVSPDGSVLAVANSYGILVPATVSLVDTRTLEVTTTLTVGGNPAGVAFSPDGGTIVVANSNFQYYGYPGSPPAGSVDLVSVIDVASRQVTNIPVGITPFFVAFAPTGHRAYIADKWSCDVATLDTDTDTVTGYVRFSFTADGCPYDVMANGDGSEPFVTTGHDHSLDAGHQSTKVDVVDTASGAITHVWQVGTDPITLALSPDGATAYVLDADKAVIRLVDTRNGALRSAIALHAPARSGVGTSTTSPGVTAP